MKLYFEAKVKSGIPEIKDRFNKELFLKLAPPGLVLKLDRFDGCEEGNEVHLRMGLPGILQKWVSKITFASTTPAKWVFVDEGTVLPFPFKSWCHEHSVTQITDSVSLISDSINYDCGNSLLNTLIWGPLWLSFRIRPKVYQKEFGHCS
ncbi:MAG: hypothetical protein EB120_06850 [Proteobacteria bacterium]|nr:hypothetical protein [Pseudomonadota bacterium]NDG26875.1 hypothetical protein [Pseudomonadota bacterium]